MKIWLLSMFILSALLATNISDEKKLILVYTQMEHCPWCHKMNKETMDNPLFKSRYEKQYILAKITRESGDIPSFLEPKYFPTTYILSADGAKVLDELPGYMPSERFVDYLEDLYEVETEVE